MAYSPTEWHNGDIISAEKLNKLENGVANGSASSGLFPITLTWNADWSIATLNKTFSEIKTALQSGLFPFVTSVSEDSGSYSLDIYSLEQIGIDTEGCSIVITIVDAGAQSLNVYYFNGMSLDSIPTYNSNA